MYLYLQWQIVFNVLFNLRIQYNGTIVYTFIKIKQHSSQYFFEIMIK